MIEEEFDLKHLDKITLYLDKHLSDFPKRVLSDDDSVEYIFEDFHKAGPGPDPLKVAQSFRLIILNLSAMLDEERVKLTIIPTLVGRFNDLVKDLRSLIVWSGSIKCPHCSAKYVYKESEIESGSVTCKNCTKRFDVP